MVVSTQQEESVFKQENVRKSMIQMEFIRFRRTVVLRRVDTRDCSLFKAEVITSHTSVFSLYRSRAARRHQSLTFQHNFLFLCVKEPTQMASSERAAPIYIQLLSRADESDENKARLSVWHAIGSLHTPWSQLRQQSPTGFGHIKTGFISEKQHQLKQSFCKYTLNGAKEFVLVVCAIKSLVLLYLGIAFSQVDKVRECSWSFPALERFSTDELFARLLFYPPLCYKMLQLPTPLLRLLQCYPR